MATAYDKTAKGSDITWINSGGTKVLTLTSLTNGSAREGDKSPSLLDATYGLPAWIDWRLESAVGSAATTGLMLEFYAGQSDSGTAGTNNPANLTGADAALSNPDELKYQATFVGVLPFSNARGTNVQIKTGFFIPRFEYFVPLIVNKSGQTLSGTAGNHKLTITPWYRTIVS